MAGAEFHAETVNHNLLTPIFHILVLAGVVGIEAFVITSGLQRTTHGSRRKSE